VIKGLPRFATDWIVISQPLLNAFQFCLVSWKLLQFRTGSYGGRSTLNDILFHNCVGYYFVIIGLQIGNVVTGFLKSPTAALFSPVLLQLNGTFSTIFLTRLILSLRKILNKPVFDVEVLTHDIAFHTPPAQSYNTSHGPGTTTGPPPSSNLFGRRTRSGTKDNPKPEEIELSELPPSHFDPPSPIAGELGLGNSGDLSTSSFR